MSSAILYLAIVAIWAGVLIPRWLRRDTSRTDSAQPAESQRPVAEGGPGNMDADTDTVEADDGTGTVDDDAGPGEYHGHETMGFRLPDPESRARVLAARRRMLMMLAGLTVAAFGIVAVRLAAWWVIIPPAGMLAGYLLLLREARHADAEREQALAGAMARAEERRRRARGRELAARGHELATQREQAVSARVIDISGRVKDELYDQYADTERRAVGD